MGYRVDEARADILCADSNRRARAARWLKRHPSRPTTVYLISSLGHTDEHVRLTIVRLLGAIGDNLAIARLTGEVGGTHLELDKLAQAGVLRAAGADPSWRVRRNCVRLVRSEWPDSLAALKSALADIHPEVRKTGISMASYLRVHELVPALASHLNSDHWGERWCACRALYLFKSVSPRVTETLLALVNMPEVAKHDATTLRIRRALVRHRVFDPARMFPTTVELLRWVLFT